MRVQRNSVTYLSHRLSWAYSVGTKAGFSFICTYVKVVSLNNLRNISAYQHDCRSVFHACLRGHWRTLGTRIVFQQIIIMLYCCWQHHINKISNAIKLNGFKYTQYIKKERNLNQGSILFFVVNLLLGQIFPDFTLLACYNHLYIVRIVWSSRWG